MTTIRVRGRLLLDGRFVPGTIEAQAGRITAIERFAHGATESGLPFVAPGLIDLHVHGYGGAEPLTDLRGMALALAAAGTTSFLPTLFPADPVRLGEDAERCARAAAALPPGSGARVLGLHLEGPFVHPRAAGALPPSDLAEPSIAALRAILGPATGDGRRIRTMTLAPELAGCAELVRELVRDDVRVSLGHSLANGEQARAAVRAGASGATHLFNAMSPFHHRDPGLAGTALLDSALFAEIIGDLCHVDRHAMELALRLRGPSGLSLVSDALPGAGTGCEVFHSHGRAHLVRDGAAWYPPDAQHPGPRLAGSATGQFEQIRRLVSAGVVDLADALTMASTTPATALGETTLGRLQEGARADWLEIDPVSLELRAVVVDGVSVRMHRSDGEASPASRE